MGRRIFTEIDKGDTLPFGGDLLVNNAFFFGD